MAWLPGRLIGSALDKTARMPNGMTIEDYENSMNTAVTLTGVWLEFIGEGDKPVGLDLRLIAGYIPFDGGTSIELTGRGRVWVKDSPNDIKSKIEQAKQLLDKNAKEFYPNTRHQFQGRLDRDCELCGKPDRHPNHNPEGKFNG